MKLIAFVTAADWVLCFKAFSAAERARAAIAVSTVFPLDVPNEPSGFWLLMMEAYD